MKRSWLCTELVLKHVHCTSNLTYVWFESRFICQ